MACPYFLFVNFEKTDEMRIPELSDIQICI